MPFQRRISKDLVAEIAATEKALASAYKVLQDLKLKKQRFLSSSPVPVIPSGGSLLDGLIPYFLFFFFFFFFFKYRCISFSPFFIFYFLNN